MADLRKLDIPKQRFEGVRVKPSDIIVNWDNNRSRSYTYSPEDVQDLLDDFSDGLPIINPLTAEIIDNKPVLIAGYRRLYAGLIWEFGDGEAIAPHPDFTVPILFAKPNSPTETLVLNARENVVRKTLNAVDLGQLAVDFESAGFNNIETAKKLGVSEAQITQHKKIFRELPEFVHILIKRGTLTADEALTLIKVDPKDRMKVLNDYLEGVGTKIHQEAEQSSEEPEEEKSIHSDKPSFAESFVPVGESNNRKQKTEKTKTLREVATESGTNVGSLRMPEFKRYLKEALESEGPGSHPGEVALKKALLSYLEGKLSSKQMDNKFEKFCKEKI